MKSPYKSLDKSSRRVILLALVIAVVPGLMGAKGGCAEQIQEAKLSVPNFAGIYTVDHSDQITVEVTLGGAVKTYTGAVGQVIDLGGAKLDLTEACALDEVHCPSEAFWNQIALDQPFFDPRGEPHNPWLLRAINLSKGKGVYGIKRGGVIVQNGHFALLLAVGGAAVGTCGMLQASVAEADLEVNDLGAATGMLLNGRVVTAYSGACLFPNDDGFVGATIKLVTTFQGRKTAPYSLPADIEDLIYDVDGNQVEGQRR